jgi:hypothetical protein
MDWNARSAWIYQNDPPDYPKLIRYGVSVVYVDPRSGNAKGVIDEMRGHGIVPGIYFDPHWNESLTPKQQAKVISDYVQIAKLIRLGEPVMLDIELLPIPWVEEFVKSYRSYLPSRPTAVTVASFQAPVIPISAFLSAGFEIYVQLYYGDMSPADGSASCLELVRAGYPPSKVHPFYDGKRFPSDARDGAIFTMERLP